MDQSKGKEERGYQQTSPATQQKMASQGGKTSWPSQKTPTGGYGGYYSQGMPSMNGQNLYSNNPYGMTGQQAGFGQMMPQQTGVSPSMMPSGGFQSGQMPSTGMGMPQQMTQQMPMTPPMPSGGPMFPGGQLPRERSYIENILRLNRGKRVRAYFTYENNEQWNAKTFTGILQEAGKDHLVIADPQSGKWYLLLMIYLDYVEFDEQIEYEYPFA